MRPSSPLPTKTTVAGSGTFAFVELFSCSTDVFDVSVIAVAIGDWESSANTVSVKPEDSPNGTAGHVSVACDGASTGGTDANTSSTAVSIAPSPCLVDAVDA